MDTLPPQPQPNQNSAAAHEDYIEVVWDGAQNAEKVRQTNIDTLALAEQFRANNKPVRVSIHIQNHPLMPNMGAFREVLNIFRAVSIDRLAISGTVSPGIMTLISTVISSFDKSLDIKYFSDPQEGLVWLRSDQK
jgi:hypothetical protein